MNGGRVVAFLGFAFGSAVSIAGNVLAVRLRPHDAPPDWSPGLDAQLGAAVWPIALLLSVEALSRVPWPRGGLWIFLRFGGVGLVALTAFLISFGHIHTILMAWNYGSLGAMAGPITVDGLMIVSGLAMLAEAKDRTARSEALPVQGPAAGPARSSDQVERSAVAVPADSEPTDAVPDGPALEAVPDQARTDWSPVPSPKRTAAAARTTRPRVAGTSRTTRTAVVPNNEEIVKWIKSQDQRPTKAVVMQRWSVGSGRALKVLNESKEASDGQED